MTIQDCIVRGGNLFIGGILLPETSNMAGLLTILNPLGSAWGNIDRTGYTVAKYSCVLSRLVAGTGAIPVSITASVGVSVAPGFRPRINLQSDYRRVPFQFMFYPNASSVLATVT